MTLLTILSNNPKDIGLPNICIKSILEFDHDTEDGKLVKGVALPWFKIIELIKKDPAEIYEISPYKWEEIIAGAYKQAGFDEVVLTPRSGDKGRDVIATINGIGSIRIFDQIKAYKDTRKVTADSVRSLIGVLSGAQNVSKGIITTTSSFAPRIKEDPFIKSFLPYRLELKDKTNLLKWLDEVAKKL